MRTECLLELTDKGYKINKEIKEAFEAKIWEKPIFLTQEL